MYVIASVALRTNGVHLGIERVKRGPLAQASNTEPRV